MSEPPAVSPSAAADALAEIRARQAQAVDATLVPNTFWPTVGGLMVAFTAAVETGRPWLLAVGTVAFVVGLTAVVGRVLMRHRAQVRTSLIGVRGGAVIAGHVFVTLALGLGTGYAAESAGFGWPATLGTTVTAVAMTATGPWVMRHLRDMMAGRPIGGGR
ncbi:hypothetical protein [Micromonospora sp. NPDC051296]|uniref:hypothetical protein n=1 Tax=Micromonospora sp. NPDC051296 TaxID=3155046 RepID=UPI0034265F13